MSILKQSKNVMHKVSIRHQECFVPDGAILSTVLPQLQGHIDHPCGGRGTCKKCIVRVNGQDELACQYHIYSDIQVEIPEKRGIVSETGIQTSGKMTDEMCFVLDLGTTTLALALVSRGDGSAAEIKTRTNPQRTFGADIMTRIDYCRKYGVKTLQSAVVAEINAMIRSFDVPKVERLYVAGNTTMLHLLLGVDCSSMGVAPYTPVFLDKQCRCAEEVGIVGVENIEALPSIAAFVGADLVAGLNCVKMPEAEKYSLLVDLGTNAEILLFSEKSILCTAAAAGPCFEGANISCGMSATDGAIYAYADGTARTIADAPAKGICGTGLIDIVAELLKTEKLDATGFLEEDVFEIAPGVQLTQGDIRQFQVAKAAVCAGIQTLLKKQRVTHSQIENVYISGGFSGKINLNNAVKTGLIPEQLGEKCVCINNSCLQGAMRYAWEQNDLASLVQRAAYVDLSADHIFTDLFVENMLFGGE